MKAIILAAGRGSRMKSVTENQPKCLVNWHGKSLLEWQLSALKMAGVDEIGIVTGYMRESLSKFNLIEFHNSDWATTQMVSSLACANEWLQTETCIVSYSDILFDLEAVTSLIECDASLAISYDPDWLELWARRFDDPLLDAETFRLNDGDNLMEIGNKPLRLEEVEGQYMGLLRFTPVAWRELQSIRSELSKTEYAGLHMTRGLQKIIERNRVAIKAVPYHGEWFEFDSESDIKAFARMQKNYSD